MNANRDRTSKEAILQIMLHPHIRSFRVRAALGKRDYKDLFSDLQLSPLDSSVPNVVGTYFLAGRRQSDAKVLTADLGYTGQACALKTQLSTGRGVKSRMFQHQEKIQQAKYGKIAKKRRTKDFLEQSPENPPASKKSVRLWASQRLAHDDIEEVSYALLSLFPVPRKRLRILDQMRFILTLAEAIDVVLLGTMSPQYSARFGGEFGLRIRPTGMPQPPFEGLNRALPTTQVVKFYSLERTNWSPAEVEIFLGVFKDHACEVYGAGAIHWDAVENLLRRRGVNKPKNYAQSLYHELAANPESGLQSFKNMKYRYLWSRFFDLKTFLVERQLVTPPKDDEDNYYHIPGLEGTLSFFQLETFLLQEGYETKDPGMWFRSFGARLLPHLLSREVWEQIHGKHTLTQ
jgi:hypothetical protein